jgi:hypothetical protein
MRPPHLLLSLVVILIGCTAATEPPGLDQYAGTYTIFTVDSTPVPFVVSQGSPCSEINTGGWATLDGTGGFVMATDQLVTVCDGVPQGSFSGGLMKGRYTGVHADLTFELEDATYSFVGQFDPGTYTPQAGGRLPSIEFQVGTHIYRAGKY